MEHTTNKGTYLLILHVATPLQQLRVGRLGTFDVATGYYVYVGSAFGAGGLPARLANHQQRHKARPHWHIDYLRAVAHLYEIWAVFYPRPLEVEWCQSLRQLPNLHMPITGFGASDTRQPAHLFYLSVPPTPGLICRALLRDMYLADSVDAFTIDITRFPPDNTNLIEELSNPSE
ncbi:MAG: GIY-YIG nuclease family protein [Chloroflexaceae bacterium]|nr:GIY-YIG nuclease family protein [Chloroflexaceae bacterium]NJO08114.1 GIY-YIG nuclease family protein [Chloroflexaceae bacterium]